MLSFAKVEGSAQSFIPKLSSNEVKEGQVKDGGTEVPPRPICKSALALCLQHSLALSPRIQKPLSLMRDLSTNPHGKTELMVFRLLIHLDSHEFMGGILIATSF